MKITVFGNFGSSNYGNELTLVTVLSHLRRMHPDAEYCCVCPNPLAVEARYGIEAVPIALGRQLWRADVLRRYFSAFGLLWRSDVFLVPGTGLLTDAYGFPDWGLYSLFKWSVMAKVCRCRILFLSVGAGPIYSAKGRRLAKLALSLAGYRSYRDDASKRCLLDAGLRVAADPVYPDLVFGLPDSHVPSGRDRSRADRPVVGLGLMVYAGRYSARDSSQSVYVAYMEALATFAEWLLEQGYDIRFLTGDDDDEVVIQEFVSLLRARVGAADERRLLHQPITSLDELLLQLGTVDLVVATRFHNVLLALVLEKPVIAISFHHKSAALMEEMGLAEYRHDINRMDATALIAQFQDVEARSELLKTRIAAGHRQFSAAVADQFSRQFAGA